jgi:hypothetical protein
MTPLVWKLLALIVFGGLSVWFGTALVARWLVHRHAEAYRRSMQAVIDQAALDALYEQPRREKVAR